MVGVDSDLICDLICDRSSWLGVPGAFEGFELRRGVFDVVGADVVGFGEGAILALRDLWRGELAVAVDEVEIDQWRRLAKKRRRQAVVAGQLLDRFWFVYVECLLGGRVACAAALWEGLQI